MKEPIQTFFKVGLIQWMSHPPKHYPLVDSVRAICRDPYFHAIEIGRMPDADTEAQVRALLAQSHLTVCYGAQPRLLGPGLNPNHLDDSERAKAERTLIEAIDEAERLGARGIAFLAGTWQAETREESYAQLLRTTRSVCDYAAKKHMQVELEVFDFDMDKKSLIGPAPLAERFAADMRTSHNNFGLLVDLSHFPTTYESSRFVIQTLRPYITHLHIGNAVVVPGKRAYGDKHPRFGFPDSANDTCELLDFFCVLKAEGFLRREEPLVLSFEVCPQEDEDGDIIIANTKRVIDRAWALL